MPTFSRDKAEDLHSGRSINAAFIGCTFIPMAQLPTPTSTATTPIIVFRVTSLDFTLKTTTLDFLIFDLRSNRIDFYKTPWVFTITNTSAAESFNTLCFALHALYYFLQ